MSKVNPSRVDVCSSARTGGKFDPIKLGKFFDALKNSAY